MREVVIVEAVRTPMGKRNGKLKDFHPVVLGSLVLKELVNRAGIQPGLVEDVVFGNVMQTGEQAVNIARNAWLAAGFPVETPATTVDRQCGSSQQAIHFAANLIQAGVCDVTVAGGVESMTRVPMGSTVVQGPGHPDDGPDDVFGARVVPEISDERTVDLENVAWQCGQVGKGRVSGTEVVEGDPKPIRPQPGQGLRSGTGIGKQSRFRDFHTYLRTGQSCARQFIQEGVRVRGVAQFVT